jgi:hypothetical protein
MPQSDGEGGADDDAGWSADDMDDGASATTNGDVPERPVLPTAPDGDRTTSSITITWAEPGTGGSAITGYSLQIWDSANSRWVIEATPTLSPYVDRGLPAGTTFHYRVAAVNAHGAGQYSPYVSATTTDAAADEPVLTATATGPNEIRVTWNVPDGNGQDITGYVLNKWNGSDWLTLGNLLPTGHDSSYTLYIDDTGTAADSTMAANTRYDYRIMSVATTASGWAYADAMTHTDVPAKPVLTATADGDDTIKLTWTEPDDNGSDVTKYELQYWDTSDRQWTDLPSVAAPVTERPHTGLEAGTNYTYRMKAQNGVGYSPWSTLVSAKTEDAE